MDKEKLKWDIDNAIDYVVSEIGISKNYLQRIISNESYNRTKYLETINLHPKRNVIDGSSVIISRVYQKLYEFNPEYRNKLLYIMFDEAFNIELITDDDSNEILQQLRPNNIGIGVTIGHFLIFRRTQLEYWKQNESFFQKEYALMVEMCKAGKTLFDVLNESIEKETGEKPYPVNTIPAKSFN